MKKFFLFLLVIFIVLPVVGMGLFLYTKLPLTGIVSLLNRAGLVTEGIEGSIAAGVSVRSAIGEGESAKFVLRNFKFEYSGLYDLYVNRRLHIRTLQLDELEYTQKKPVATQADGQSPNPHPTESPSPSQPTKKGAIPEIFREVLIDEIRIGKVVFILNGTQTPATFALSKFEVDGVKSVGEKFEFKRFTVDSNYLAFEIIPAPAGTEGFRLSGNTKAILSPYFLQDFPWQGTLAIENHELRDLSVEAFNGKLRAKKIGEDLQFEFDHLVFGEFFRDTFPITGLNGKATWAGIQTPKIENVSASGLNIRLGVSEFQAPEGVLFQKIPVAAGQPESYGFTASTKSSGKQYHFSFRMDDHTSSKDPSSYAFSLASSIAERADDIIAEVYYGKTYAKLSAEEKPLIAKASEFFRMPLPPPMKLAPLPAKRGARRR